MTSPKLLSMLLSCTLGFTIVVILREQGVLPPAAFVTLMLGVGVVVGLLHALLWEDAVQPDDDDDER